MNNAPPGPSKSLIAVLVIGPSSRSALVTPLIVYGTLVALATLVVVSVIVVDSPSVIVAELAASAYEAPAVLVSLIVTALDVATTDPPMLPVLI